MVLEERYEPVLTLTLNRPRRLNAVNPELYGTLLEALRRAEGDPEIRVVVLTGAPLPGGGKAPDRAGGDGVPRERALREEARILIELFGTEDWAEGVAAFREGRSPRYEGR